MKVIQKQARSRKGQQSESEILPIRLGNSDWSAVWGIALRSGNKYLDRNIFTGSCNFKV